MTKQAHRRYTTSKKLRRLIKIANEEPISMIFIDSQKNTLKIQSSQMKGVVEFREDDSARKGYFTGEKQIPLRAIDSFCNKYDLVINVDYLGRERRIWV